MDWLNYHHLLYFWVVAREGTVTAAAQELRLSPSTVSEQIRRLEETLGLKLFQKRGRNIELTDSGQEVFRYADDIFRLGRELTEFAAGRQVGRLRLNVGLSMVVPKLIAFKLLQPALAVSPDLQISCREAPIAELLADLALHHLDVVITDAPLGPDARIRAFNHLLAECGTVFLGTAELAGPRRATFPHSLHGAPVILPTPTTVLRRQLDRYFDQRGIRPHVVGEFDDSALVKVFGEEGMGLFPVPDMIADKICAQYNVEVVGRAEGVNDRFYAVSVERQIRHLAVAAMCGVVTIADHDQDLEPGE